MHIIAIGWLYVVLLMALTEREPLSALLLFLFLGVMPLALVAWIATSSLRRKRRERAAPAEQANPVRDPSKSEPTAAPDDTVRTRASSPNGST